MLEKENQRKGIFLVDDKECFALSHFSFSNQNYVFVFISSTVKVFT